MIPASRGRPPFRAARPRSRSLFARALLANARGASSVEYVMIVGIVALAALQAFAVFGAEAKEGIGRAGVDVAGLGF